MSMDSEQKEIHIRFFLLYLINMAYNSTPRIKPADEEESVTGEYLTKKQKYEMLLLNREDNIRSQSLSDFNDVEGITGLAYFYKDLLTTAQKRWMQGFDAFWIAGGSISSCMYGSFSQAGDVDFWFSNLRSFQQTAYTLVQEFGYTLADDDDMRRIWEIPQRLKFIELLPTSKARINKKIQLVKMQWYERPEQVIKDFDLAHCQFIISEHNINYPKTTELGLYAAQEKKIFVRGTTNPSTLVGRIRKYMERGFTLPDCTTKEDNEEALKRFSLNVSNAQTSSTGTYTLSVASTSSENLWDNAEYRKDYVELPTELLVEKWGRG